MVSIVPVNSGAVSESNLIRGLHSIKIVLAAGALAACNGGQSRSRSATFSEGVGDAAATPLEDLNVSPPEISDIFIQARAEPYELVGMGRCNAISAEASRLDELSDLISTGRKRFTPSRWRKSQLTRRSMSFETR